MSTDRKQQLVEIVTPSVNCLAEEYRQPVLDYVLWLDTPVTQRGPEPVVPGGKIRSARSIYRNALDELHRYQRAKFDQTVHTCGGQDPQVFEDGASHRRGIGDITREYD